MYKARLAVPALALFGFGAIPGLALAKTAPQRIYSGSADTIFGNGTPQRAATTDSNGVELGVKFTSSQNGNIAGIRFYKGSGNTGVHVGSLYSATGQLLASATFSHESRAGWQTVNFAQPVAIQSGTTYVAAYFAPRGHYAETVGGLSNAATNGPLTALANSTSANGLYSYANSSTFPISSYQSDNYWVDVRFVPAAATSTTTTTPTTTTTTPTTTTTTTPTTTTTTPTTTTTTTTPPPPPPPANTTPPSISGTATQGNTLTATNGTWSGSPTGYGYQWQDCTANGCQNISGATSSSYALQVTDVGSTVDVVVTATNAGGSTAATSAETAVVQSNVTTSSSAAVVGTAGEPSVTCTQTITPSTTIQSALSSAAAGSTICLNGAWSSAQSISATAPSSNVTVAAAPGDAATVAGLSIGYGQVSNLTFEGIHFTGGVSMTDCASNLRFLDNNFQDISDQSAFYMYYGGDGDSNCSQTGITMEYNQIDHTGECLEVATNTSNQAQESGITFSHNVCGPDIGYGCVAGAQCNVSGHYVQMSNTENDSIDNNAFLGPVDPNLNPTCNSEYSHVNVFHETGSSTNLDFSNNIIWHTQACGETIMFQSGGQINDTINNNLLVEDPNWGDAAYEYNLYGLDGVTFDHNTTIPADGNAGVLMSGGCTDCGSAYTNPQNVTAEDNLTVHGQPDYAGWSCTGTCKSADNVSDGSSALAWGPATGSRGNWKPDFRSTSWSPNSGLPWSPPPAGYYEPANLPSADGYQGAIGP